MGTANRSGTISTTSGLTRSGRIGVVATKATNTEIVGGLAMTIAEASRKLSPDVCLYSRRGGFIPDEVTQSGSFCLLRFNSM